MNQDEALQEFHTLASEHGVNLNRTSTCYPPACRIHQHSEPEKAAWAAFVSSLHHDGRGHKPDRTEGKRS